jgi:hypothetical protein
MPRPHTSRQLRRLVIDRAGGCCEYCLSQARFSPQALSVEHITPIHAGGPTRESNLALSCQGCNSHKAVKTIALDPLTGLLASLFNPRQENWYEHFTWSDDYSTMQGITPTGRATILALRLNREGLVTMRRVLYAMGEHPPVAPDARKTNE